MSSFTTQPEVPVDYGTLPPEINSLRIFSGPGSASLRTAAAAWDDLAIELDAATAGYEEQITNLTGGRWLGAAATAMAAAVSPYLAWMRATAQHAAQAGAQAKAAAAAYESALAMTVPPPLIAANRAQLIAQLATNILGQNSAAIATAESDYGEMWARDAAAMYGYAGLSSSATCLTPFDAPAQADPNADLAGQSAVMAAVPQALQDISSPPSTSTTNSSLLALNSLNTLTTPLRLGMYPMNFLMRALSFAKVGAAPAAAANASTVAGLPPAITPSAGFPTDVGSTVAGPRSVAATLGKSVLRGTLSVPPAWAAGIPASAPVAAGLPTGGIVATPMSDVTAVPPIVPVTTAPARRADGVATQYDVRPTVIRRSPAAG